ncbi:MAG: DUF5009 domain-containing protein [Muribaculaceae bacterium]|nr:DUF5009 domain-containing protein [Muribaculaceae bacterium]
MTQKTVSSGRLGSLDILRGLDLFMLVFAQPVIVALGAVWHPDWLAPLLRQLDHEVWEGFRCWDLVMPLFLFMTGAAMPFSMSKFRRADGGVDRAAYVKIVRRFLVLFLLGMVVQGNLLWFRADWLRVYTNTLQAIATGYLVSALIILHCRGWRGQLVATAALLLVYSVPMSLAGDWSMTGNFAYRVDELILGRLRGDLSYTWVWSSLTFSVTVMLGVFAGRIIKEGPRDRMTATALRLALIGAALVAAGWLWSFHTPVIKRIWTGSMTLLSGGYCFLLMALFYWIVDVRGHSRGLGWLKIYGMNSILAYMLGEVVNFRSIAASLTFGLEPWLGDFYGVWLTFANFLILFFLLRHLYRHRIFLKI